MPSTEKTLKGVVFTLNNPPEDLTLWHEDRMDYLVYQFERGEQGTLHVQGYVEFTKRTRFATVKKLLGGDSVHIEPRRGTATQARDYCMKEDTRQSGPFEFGEFKEISQGQRNDITALIDAAKAGKGSRHCLDEFPETYFRNYRAYHHVRLFYPPARKPREVVVLIGPSGAGKTSYVYAKHPDVYETTVESLNGFWFDGYDDHEVALIDDFSGQWPYKTLLRLLHEYPAKVPIKGGHTWWNPSIIYITTNEPWEHWYMDDHRHRGNMLATLGRRISRVVVFPLEEKE